MRIASLLPTATELLYALGLGRCVTGRSEHCVYPPQALKKPVIVRSEIAPITKQDSLAIHNAVLKFQKENRHQFSIDTNLLKKSRPDWIITQNLCAVCAASHPEISEALTTLSPAPQLFTLQANTIPELLAEIGRMGVQFKKKKEAARLVREFQRAIRQLGRKTKKIPAPRVWCCEWLEPLMAAGHWVPEMITMAGGKPLFAEAGQKSVWLDWKKVQKADPEVILIFPCSYSMQQTNAEISRLTRRAGWKKLSAVKNGRVYIVDGELFHHAGPRLITGTRLAARLIHPELSPARGLSNYYRKVPVPHPAAAKPYRSNGSGR